MAGSATPAAGSGVIGLLDLDDRADLLNLGRSRGYRAGAWILSQGDRGDTVSVLLEGRVKVTFDTIDGREIVLSILSRGDLFGEFEAIDPDPTERAASVVALEPVRCQLLTAEEFRSYLRSHPNASLALIRWLIDGYMAADRRRIEGTLRDTPHRLAAFLLELADRGTSREAPAVDLAIPLAQHELGSLIGVSRNSVVRALAILRSTGLVTTTRHTISIKDPRVLREYVD